MRDGWQLLKRPRPLVKIEMADGHTLEGTAVEWRNSGDTSSVAVNTSHGVLQFGLETGRISRTKEGLHPMKPRIRADSLEALKANLASRASSLAWTDDRMPRSEHVIIAANDELGTLVIEGAGHVIHLLAPAGYQAAKLAEEIEAVFALVEQRVKANAVHRENSRRGGRVSAAKRKTTRTHRPRRDD